MALPRVEVVVEADTARAEAGLNRVQAELSETDRRLASSSRTMATANRSTGSFGRGLQNASFQVADFAVQVGAGTRASQALAQQLPQLLGGFGILGAALGAVVAVAVPLRNAMQGMSNDANVMGRAFADLQPALTAIREAFAAIQPVAVTAIELLINNLDRLVVIGATAAAFFGVKFVAGMVAARIATMTLAGSLAFLRGALIRTGIGALIVGAGELVFQFLRLTRAAGGFGEAFGMVKEVASEALGRVGTAVAALDIKIAAVALRMRASMQGFAQDVVQGSVDAANGLIGNMTGAAEAIGTAITNITTSIATGVVSAVNFAIEKIESLIELAVGGVNTMITALNSIPGMNLSTVSFGGLGRVSSAGIPELQSISGAFERGRSGAYQVPMPDMPDGSENLRSAELFDKLSSDFFGLSTAPLESVQKIRDLLASIKDDNLTLPDLLGMGGGKGEDGEGGGGGGKSASEKLDEELTAQEERIKEHFDRIRNLTQGGLSDKLGAWGDYFTNLATLTGTNNRKLLAAAKAFGAAQALIDAWTAHNKVLADPTLPWFARIASAAQVFAAGIGAVNAIRSVSESGTGGAAGGAVGTGASANTNAAPAQVSRTANVTIVGEVFGRDQMVALADQLAELQRDGMTSFTVSA